VPVQQREEGQPFWGGFALGVIGVTGSSEIAVAKRHELEDCWLGSAHDDFVQFGPDAMQAAWTSNEPTCWVGRVVLSTSVTSPRQSGGERHIPTYFSGGKSSGEFHRSWFVGLTLTAVRKLVKIRLKTNPRVRRQTMQDPVMETPGPNDLAAVIARLKVFLPPPTAARRRKECPQAMTERGAMEGEVQELDLPEEIRCEFQAG
jgi:hypothetical protein